MDPTDKQALKRAAGAFLRGKADEAAQLLSELVRFDSVYGNEEGVQDFLCRRLDSLGIPAKKDFLSEETSKHPAYSGAENELPPAGRYNVTAELGGMGRGRSVIVNAHTDVVPAPGWADAFSGSLREGAVIGRGACDDKGSAAAMLLAMEAMKRLDARLSGRVAFQFVIDEEIGGNGSLDLLLKGCRADCAVVMEPTELRAYIAGRGCFWFKIGVPGVSVHMAEIDKGISAADNAIEVAALLKRFEAERMRPFSDHPLFRWHTRPQQLNVGILRAGDYPSMVPGSAVIEGGLGFLPSRAMKDWMAELEGFVRANANPWLKDRLTFRYDKLKNEAYEEDAELECVVAMRENLRSLGLPDEARGFIASCDARLFHHVGHMPALVFGPGAIRLAHSDKEECPVDEVVRAAEALCGFIIEWCN